MRKSVFQLAVAALLLNGSAWASDAPAIMSQLESGAARCRLKSLDGSLDLDLAKQGSGEKSPYYQKVSARVSDKIGQCVAREKGKAQRSLQEAISAYPALRQVLLDTHAAYLGYMDWLSVPRDIEAGPEELAYDAAINRLKAALAASPQAQTQAR